MEKDQYPKYIEKVIQFVVAPGQKPERLDIYLTSAIHNATRNKVQAAIHQGNVTVNGSLAKVSRKTAAGDVIECRIMKPPPLQLIPENIPLDIVYDDESLLVVNKPPGLVVHPAFGHRYGTLVNALLFYMGLRESVDIDESEVEERDDDDVFSTDHEILTSDAVRPGIVHRLDKDTSGLLLVAKNSIIHAKLAKQFSERTVQREYWALAWGIFKNDHGDIQGMIGRSPKNRKIMAILEKDGKFAHTHYQVIERLGIATLVKFNLKTGRTHQIRVHSRSLGHPLLADLAYGGGAPIGGNLSSRDCYIAEQCLTMLHGQALHARTLGFYHPELKKNLYFEASPPIDFMNVLNLLQKEYDI